MTRPNPIVRGGAAAGALLVLVVAVPALLVATSTARFGHASPLHGMAAPWHWTLDSARSWWHYLVDELDTSGELVDVFVRLALVLAWVGVAVVVLTVVGEVVYQLRHGMPSSGRRNVLGLAWLGRVVATGLVALLPLVTTTPALAHGSSGRGGGPVAAAGPTPGVMARADGSTGAGDAARSSTAEIPAPDGPGWSTYVVQRGDSVWSIAGSIAGNGGDVGGVATQIVEANRGVTMPDGQRFTTPALIEPGWQLAVPAADGGAPSQPLRRHTVAAGDSYWRIASADLTSAGGTTPTEAEVLERTEALIDLNAPRLGHADPRLLLPGESVELPDVGGADAAPVVVSSSDPPPPAGVSVAPPGDNPVVAPPAGDPTPPASDSTVDVAPPAALDPILVTVGLDPPALAATDASAATGGGAVLDGPPAAPPASSDDEHLAAASTPAAETAPAAGEPPVPGSEDPTPPSVVADATGDSDSSIGVGFGGAVLFAAGALGLLEARRRRRLRSATLDHRLPGVDPAEASTERALRSAAAPERIARLDVALRMAAPQVAACGARIVAVEMLGSGELRMSTSGPAAPSGDAWQLDVDGRTWVLAPRWTLEDLAGRTRHATAPCPALAHIGATEGGQLYLDLEAVGLLAVDLPEPMATDVVRCIAASIAFSPLAGSLQLITVGMPAGLFDAGGAPIEEAATLDAALELAAAALGSTRRAARDTTTFALRCCGLGAEGWEPAVVIAAGGAEALDAARDASGDGLAVVVAEPVSDADWRLERRGGHVVLEPLGVALTPCGLSVGAISDVHALLEAATTPLELRGRVVALPSARAEAGAVAAPTVDAAGAEPPWSLLVRLFGQVEVVAADGTPAAFERSKALELVVWLSQHRRRPTRTAARTALWEVDVRDATFANVVSEARRAMARAAAPPAGEEWLARTLTEDLPLHAEVVTDADLVTARVERARAAAARDAVELLRPGVELLTGMPFAGASYLWTDAEGLGSSLTLLAIGASLQMARAALELGEIDDVFWATGHGLQVLPGHEELIAVRMEAHAAAGDLAGVRHEWASYERALDADPWSAAAPSPKLFELRRRLLSAPGAAAGQ